MQKCITASTFGALRLIDEATRRVEPAKLKRRVLRVPQAARCILAGQEAVCRRAREGSADQIS